jgi:SPP1 gp7 family putative phage head morphogenesis protein
LDAWAISREDGLKTPLPGNESVAYVLCMKQHTHFPSSLYVATICELGLKNQHLIARSMDCGELAQTYTLRKIDNHLSRLLQFAKQAVFPSQSEQRAADITQYIWRTQGDGKVRATHAANNGHVFSWNNSPETGHPSEDYNCRCYAEPYIRGQSEFANQVVVAAEGDNPYQWTNADFSLHFYLGEGRGLSLSQTGHLSGVMDYYFYTLGKYNDVNAQIIEEARRYDGAFGYHFDSPYEFRPYLYVFGGGVVSGVFTGTVRRELGTMTIVGEVEYFYDDTFTDPLDARELVRGTSDPDDATLLQVRISDFGGRQFPVRGYWKTRFTAQAKLNRSDSIYSASL